MKLNLLVPLTLACNLVLFAGGVRDSDQSSQSIYPGVLRIERSSTVVSSQAVADEENSVVDIKGKSAAAEVGRWQRYEVAFNNPSWSGNPFDLELVGIFTHVGTGRTVTQLGFYAGNNVWKIYFMPDELGAWSYVTASPDPELDGKSGSFDCVASDLPGKLVGDGNRWGMSSSGDYVSPIMIPTKEWFKGTSTADGIDDFMDWADHTVGAMLIGTTLVYFGGPQPGVPYINGQEGETFNIPMWDRLNSHYDYLRDHGMGLYIMFYADDEDAPSKNGIGPNSAEEMRLFRYAIARFSAYPIVIWDTGIDIGETRSNSWIDWFAGWFRINDPWDHPVSSRTGGGSGGKFPAGATYYSDGFSTLPSNSAAINAWESRSVPTAYTDRWREDYTRGNFDRDGIRRAVWEVGLVGGPAIYVGGNENSGYLGLTYGSDFKAAPDVGCREYFFRKKIDNFGKLMPTPNLVTTGGNTVLVADPGKEYVAYNFSGGNIGINLSGVNGTVDVEWFNPRTGDLVKGSSIQGGGNKVFSPPFAGDVVLHLTANTTNNLFSLLSAVNNGFNLFIPMLSRSTFQPGAVCNP